MFKLLILLAAVAYVSAGGLYSGYGLGYGSSYGYGTYGLGHGYYSPVSYPLATSYANVYKVPPSVTKIYPAYTKFGYSSPLISKLGYSSYYPYNSYYGYYPSYYSGYTGYGHGLGYTGYGHGYGYGYGNLGYGGYGHGYYGY